MVVDPLLVAYLPFMLTTNKLGYLGGKIVSETDEAESIVHAFIGISDFNPPLIMYALI